MTNTYLYYHKNLIFIGKGIKEEDFVIKLDDAFQALMVQVEAVAAGGKTETRFGFNFFKLGIVEIAEDGVLVELSTDSPFYQQYLAETTGIVSGTSNIMPMHPRAQPQKH